MLRLCKHASYGFFWKPLMYTHGLSKLWWFHVVEWLFVEENRNLMITCSTINIIFCCIGGERRQCSCVLCTFRPYVCAVLIRTESWLKMLESEFWFVTCFSIMLMKKTAYVDICKDAKAIHQLTLHDKSYTGFF